jgi:hypothetical protein
MTWVEIKEKLMLTEQQLKDAIKRGAERVDSLPYRANVECITEIMLDTIREEIFLRTGCAEASIS